MITQEEIAEIIWNTWVKETEASIDWEDAPLYAFEDWRCVNACATEIVKRLP